MKKKNIERRLTLETGEKETRKKTVLMPYLSKKPSLGNYLYALKQNFLLWQDCKIVIYFL